MPQYEFIRLDKRGRKKGRSTQSCDTEADALEVARALATDRDVEIRCKGERITVITAEKRDVR